MSPNFPSVSEEDPRKRDTCNRQQRFEILYDGYYYDVTDWISRHPGGSVIKFYTEKGENSTIPIQQFHYRSLPKVFGIMKSFKKRPATKEELTDSLSTQTLQRHRALTRDYLKLYKELEDEGFFVPSIPHIFLRWSEIIFWMLTAIYLKTIGNHWMAAVAFGITGARAGMLNHETGHYSMTGIHKFDKVAGSLLFGFVSGLSASWWRSQHNRHHAMPQRLQHDVDLETMPFIAFNSSVVRKPKDGKSFFIKYQKYLFATLDTALVIPYWKLWLHPRYLLKKGEYMDLVFISIHYYLSFVVFNLTILQYWLAIWIGTTYLFVIFAMNHSHLDVTSDNLHWVEYCLVHTVDVTANWAVDIWMNFLNYQIEHHLFPAMPQFRQRAVKNRVKALAEKHGLPYRTMGFWEALNTVFSNLEEVSSNLQQLT